MVEQKETATFCKRAKKTFTALSYQAVLWSGDYLPYCPYCGSCRYEEDWEEFHKETQLTKQYS